VVLKKRDQRFHGLQDVKVCFEDVGSRGGTLNVLPQIKVPVLARLSIEDKGANSLAESLNTDATVAELSLQNNQTNDFGLLMEHLKNNANMRALYLVRSPIQLGFMQFEKKKAWAPHASLQIIAVEKDDKDTKAILIRLRQAPPQVQLRAFEFQTLRDKSILDVGLLE